LTKAPLIDYIVPLDIYFCTGVKMYFKNITIFILFIISTSHAMKRQHYIRNLSLHQIINFNNMSEAEKLALVHQYIKKGGNVNKKSAKYKITALQKLSMSPNEALILALRKAGANPYLSCPEGECAITCAIKYGRTDNISTLLADIPDKDIYHNRKVVFKNINWKDKEGNGFLHHAFKNAPWNSHEVIENIVKVLLSFGANPNIENYSGYTPLHYAALTPNSENSILALLDAHANPNAQLNSMNYTPLHFAATQGDCTANILALLNGGADKELRSKKNKLLPIDTARLYGMEANIKLLQ
jgi:ankyrin repeat protein